MKGLPENVSEATRKRNPHLYGGGLGKVETHKPKPAAVAALVKDSRPAQAGKEGMGYRITFVVVRKRSLLDSDNLQGALKPLRDAVAYSLGIDDGDPRIEWEYHQIKSTQPEGVTVMVTILQ